MRECLRFILLLRNMRCIAVSRLQNVLRFLNNDRFKIYLKASRNEHVIEHVNTVRVTWICKDKPRSTFPCWWTMHCILSKRKWQT